MASHALNIQISLESNKDFGAFCFHVHPHKRSIQPKGLPLWIQPPTKQIMRMLKTSIKMAGTQKVNMLGVGARAKGEGSTARGYNYKWQKARERFLSDNPLCCYCERIGRVTAASVVDHKIPHRGDESLFWNESNWQPLCKPCHDITKASNPHS